MTILIVDDDSEVREMMRCALEGEGYEVECAGDFNDAQAKLLTGEHQLVILDHRLWGRHYDEELHPSLPPGVPVIFCTGDSDIPAHHPADRPHRFLRKPVDTSTLLETVRSLLAAGSAANRPRRPPQQTPPGVPVAPP